MPKMSESDALESLVRRFLSRVDKDGPGGCWLWAGYRDRDGYGVLNSRKKIHKAHRLSYEIHHGPIQSGLCVCHSCDVPSCVNPAHLFLGTNYDNVKDKVDKGRQLRGEQHGRATLCAYEVRQIKAAREIGWKVREIGYRFGISHQTVSKICLGIIWKHITEPAERPPKKLKYTTEPTAQPPKKQRKIDA